MHRVMIGLASSLISTVSVLWGQELFTSLRVNSRWQLPGRGRDILLCVSGVGSGGAKDCPHKLATHILSC
jgi:hypothetical protein